MLSLTNNLSFRIFMWGVPAPSGNTYDKEVAIALVDKINNGGMMASFSESLNIHLVSALATKAELKGNVVYAEFELLSHGEEDIENWGTDNYGATVVIKVKPDHGDPITMKDVTDMTHIYLYRN